MCFQFPERKEASSILTNTTASTSQSINASEIYNLLTKIESTITSSKISLESVINNQVMIEQQKSEVFEQKKMLNTLSQTKNINCRLRNQKKKQMNQIRQSLFKHSRQNRQKQKNQTKQQSKQLKFINSKKCQPKRIQKSHNYSLKNQFINTKPLIQERIQTCGQEDEITKLRQRVQDQQLTIQNLKKQIKELEQFSNILENQIKIEEIKNKELEEKNQQFNPALRLSSGSRTARNVWQNKSALFPQIDKR